MILAQLKLTIQSFSKNLVLSLLTMVLFPVIMVPMMSFFNSDMYGEPQEDLNIPIAIVDHDQTELSGMLADTLSSDAMAGLVLLSDEPDFTITIPEGYADALQNHQPQTVTVEGIIDASGFQGETLRSVLENLSKAFQTALRLEQSMDGMPLMPGHTLRIQNAVLSAQNVQTVQREIHEPPIRIAPREYFSLQYIQLIFMLFLTSYATANRQQLETTDLEMRMASLPVHPVLMQISEMITAAFQIFIFGMLYILVVRTLGWGFSGSLPLYTLALLTGSFFVAGFSIVFTMVLPPKLASAAGSVVMMFFMFFGGMVGSPAMFHGTPLETFARLDLQQILAGPFWDVNLGQFGFSSLRLFLIGTVVFLLITLGVQKCKKGVLK